MAEEKSLIFRFEYTINPDTRRVENIFAANEKRIEFFPGNRTLYWHSNDKVEKYQLSERYEWVVYKERSKFRYKIASLDKTTAVLERRGYNTKKLLMIEYYTHI